MTVNDSDLNPLIDLITLRTGIIPRESHREGIRSYLERKIDEMRLPSVHAYLSLLRSDKGILEELINESTVNETYFFRDNEDGSFSLKAFNPANQETRPLESFTGSLNEDYIVRGRYIFNKKTGSLLNVITGDAKQVTYTCFKDGFIADLFEISENGRYCAVRGLNDGAKCALGIMDLQTGVMTAYTDEVFNNVANITLTDDGAAIVSVKDTDNGFYQLTAAFAADAPAENTTAAEGTEAAQE